MPSKFYASSASDDWATPEWIKVNYQDYFDPCPLYSIVDGLSTDWLSPAFVNPPYSDLKSWSAKAIEQAKKGCKIVLLVPLRPSSKWFQSLIDYGGRVAFFRKRLRFNDCKTVAPFESCLIYL